MSINANFAKVNVMNQVNSDKNFSDTIGQFSVPISLLVIGQNKQDWFRGGLISNVAVIKEDVLDVSPSSEGKKEIISIKQSRELIHWLSLKPQGRTKIAFIHSAHLLNIEAANALLKIIEEMPKQAILVLFMPRLETLPTIKSRCRIIELKEQVSISNEHGKYISAFISQNFAKQSKSIDEIIKNGKTNQFLLSLEEWARGKMLESKSAECVDRLENIFTARRNIRSNANAKLTLENLILSLR